MFCPQCGASLKDGSRFCENCGARLSAAPAQQTTRNEYVFEDAGASLAPGYSRMIDSPKVRQALEKQRGAAKKYGAVLCVLPLLGFLIYSFISQKMSTSEGLLYGVIVSAIFAVTMLISSAKQKKAKPFEGNVADKRHERRVSHDADGDRTTHDSYFVWVDGTDGKRHKKEVTPTMFNYLQVGDRVRYLPEFPQPFEKYDKSRDAEIPCMICGHMNAVANDTCRFCKNPLIK